MAIKRIAFSVKSPLRWLLIAYGISVAMLGLIDPVDGQALLTHEEIQSWTRSEISALTQFPAQQGATAYAVRYMTSGSDGLLDTASGLIVLPEKRSVQRMISYQYGDTDGLDLIPSKLNPEGTLAVLYAGQGYVVSVTDYLGHGTSRGFHPYVHAATQASAALDLLIGTKDFAQTQGFESIQQIFVTGYSQGAHASMALARAIEQRVTDDLWITASACNAGPYSLSGVMRNLLLDPQTEYRVPAFLPYNILGYETVYGDVFEQLSDVFKPAYVDRIQSFFDGKISRNALNEFLVAELKKDVGKSRPRAMLSDIYLSSFESDSLHPMNVHLRENDTYRWIPTAPMRLFYCSADQQVPAENALIAAEYMKNRGAADVEAIELDKEANHEGCVLPSILATLAYFQTFNTTTSNDQLINNQHLVFPNPADRELQVQGLQGTIDVQIWNQWGQVLHRGQQDASQSIKIGNLSTGLYWLQMDGPTGRTISKFVVNR